VAALSASFNFPAEKIVAIAGLVARRLWRRLALVCFGILCLAEFVLRWSPGWRGRDVSERRTDSVPVRCSMSRLLATLPPASALCHVAVD